MSGTITVNGAPALTSIAVTPANPSVPKGLTEQFDAVGTFSDGSTQDLTTQVTWASASTSVATISNNAGTQGLATALSQGTSTIGATLGSVTGSTVLTVTAPVLQSIGVTPANPSLAKGLTQQFTATGTYSDSSTQDLTGQVTWASATPTVATIAASGLATAVGTGTSTISAALGGVSGSTTLTVTAAVLQSIGVTPANPSLAKGLTQQFTATGTYSDSSTQDLTSQVTWASATPAVATITAGGLATAVATGTSSISATLGSVTGTTVLTVTAAVLQSIAVTPANPTLAKGATQQFAATGTYSDSSTQDLTGQVTWASATPSVATIAASGLATAVGTGTSTISAALGGMSGSTVLTVTAAVLQSIAVTPANPSLAVGTTVQFAATGTYSDSSTQDLTGQVTWASATPAVATITAGGLATAVATGTSSISATLGSVAGSTVLTVGAAVLQSIAVTPANPSLAKGLTQQFTATGAYSDKSTQDLTGQVTWASSDTAVASISNSPGSIGLASGLTVGTSTISAMFGGIGGSTVLTVTAAALESIAVTPSNPSIPVGEVQPFIATGTYSDNSTQDLTSQVTWASGTTSVATIASDGVATGLAVGTSSISATLGEVSGSTTLTVTPVVLEMIMITPANSTVAKGQTVSYMAMGMYSDNSTVDLTNQVTWASSDTSVATISNDPGTQGLATAVADGKSTISASLGGVTGSTGLTVATPDLNPAAVRDNGQAGYYQYGTWTVGATGFNGTSSSADPATSPSASARWLLNVPAGTYEVWATWTGGASNATNATYSVYDGFTNLGSAVENQQVAPDGGNYGGALWAMLGTFDVSKGRITVILGAGGADGQIVADAVLLVPNLSAMDSAGGGSTSSMAMALTSSNMGSTAQMDSSAQSPQGPPSGQPLTQVQAVAALPLQTSPSETSQQSRHPSIQISGLTPSAPSTPSLTVNYTADSTATMPSGSGPINSIVLSSQGSRKVAKKHRPVHESLIRRIASDRMLHRRSTEPHHGGK